MTHGGVSSRTGYALTLAAALFAAHAARADTFIVQEGKPRAEIIVAEEPPRTVQLAARELQRYVEKISGAKLPIATAPRENVPVEIYVGKSRWTDELGVSADGLKYGAYRIVSGEGWLVLIGDDTDFTPVEPWPRSNSHWVGGEVHRQWDQVTGAKWGNPMAGFYKHYTGRAFDFGKPKSEWVDKSDTIHVWAFDERGSFNAVCGFLRSLGVRWYMPGELGEVVPSLRSIPLPEIDETVRPAFPMRRFCMRFKVHGRDVAMWAMHLGTRDPYGFQVAHGLATMTHREEMLEAHPEFYALYGGKRHNRPGQRLNQLCYSNEELFRENLRYIRALFDHYRFDVVSVMPPDGFTAMCQCPLCEGRDTPERGDRGRLSDYVWGYVNRVAKEIGKTHPQKKVLCAAYGAYKLPPLKIDKLEPNVQVCIVGGRRIQDSKPEQREAVRQLRDAWLAKTDNPIVNFENYPLTDRGWYLPAYVPHVVGESINALKGDSLGEDVWFSVGKDFHAAGFNHFNVYLTARMCWEEDVDALFDEYCRLFYGPAQREMKSFFEYCEVNWQDMQLDKQKVDRALGLFSAARAKVEPDSVYGKRVALVADYLEALKNRGIQLEKDRGPVPELRLARDAAGILIDGKLDEPFWQDCPYHAVGRLRELQTGRKPVFGTTLKAAWGKDGVYFAVRCEERPGDPVSIGTKKNEDPAIWYGDVVEILLETDSHSYYQIAVNPAGAIVDLDRQAPKGGWYQWDSQAQVATDVGEDYWTVEVRIPVVEKTSDPLHQVVGRKPTGGLPWYFNVCRQRVRDNGAEHSAFSPTGTKTFHEVLKFAKLYEK